MTRIRNHFNFDTASNFEKVEGVSVAVPDQTYSVKDLFQRMARGLPLDDRCRAVPTYYDDDPDIDNPDPTQRPDFDLVDYQEEMQGLHDSVSSRHVVSDDGQSSQRERSESVDEKPS